MQSNSQRPFQYTNSPFKWFVLTRKTILIIFLVCVCFAYFGPHYLLRAFQYLRGDYSFDDCVQKYLERHEAAVSRGDAYIKYWSKEDPTIQFHDGPLSLVGNGKLAVVVKPDSRLHIIYPSPVVDQADKTSIEEMRSFELPFKPILKPELMSGNEASRTMHQVLNFREGILETLSCFTWPGASGLIFMNHTVVAHRSRPNVFLQHTEAIYNGNKQEKIEIPMKLTDVNSNLWKEEKKPDNFILRSGSFKVSEKDHMSVSIASKISKSVLEIGSDGHGSIDAIHVVTHSSPKSSRILAKKEELPVQDSASKQYSLIKGLSMEELLHEHKKSWEDILHTGLTVTTTSEESGLPSPLLINETLYYVLSCSNSNLHNQDIPEDERRNLVQRLQTPEFCYHGHPTFHGPSLWRQVASVQEAMQLQRHWALTLRKNQCKSLVSEGAEGILQAMLLSFGGFRFTKSDLRLNMDPLVLHNNIGFHRLIYRNDTITINIRQKQGGNSPVILVALEGTPKIRLFACEAGCIHEPVELGRIPRELPVFVTDPVTAILYISHDRRHLRDLRDTIHVKNRVDHARHMEDHRKTGLPTIFWFGIGSLVIFFHLFLIQLIYREYHSSSNYSGKTSKYASYNTRERLHS